MRNTITESLDRRENYWRSGFKRWRCAIALALSLYPALRLHAADLALMDPISSRNLSPIYQSIGIPVLRSASPVSSGRWRVEWDANVASHSVRESARERLYELDGETLRSDLSLRFGVSDQLTLTMNLPFVRHSGGQLDSLIDGWHAFFGLPDGARDSQPQDRLLFDVASPGIEPLERSVSGLGDPEVELAGAFAGTGSWKAAWLLNHKFALGDEKDFLGSGENATSLGLRLHIDDCLLRTLRCYGQVGATWLWGELPDQSTDQLIPFASFGLAWQARQSIALVAQLDYHEDVYKDSLLIRNGPPVWGTLALRWRASNSWQIEAGFAEDLAVGASPDINFRFSLHYLDF
ncbi:MAG: DUF3187 family protein [Pseudomonadota bacterium]